MSRCEYNSNVGGTRKIVNYICRGRSPRKRGWKTNAVLMFNSLAGYEYRGERPNELSGSWFQSKCLAGQRYISGTFGREDVGFDQQTPNER